MAFWQFPVLLVPSSIARASARVDMDADHWVGEQPSRATLDTLRTILPPRESWSEEMDMFGEKRGDTITLVLDDDRKSVLEIVLRIDCSRELNLRFIDRVCELLRDDPQLAMVDRHGRPIEPKREALIAATEASPAGKFRLDPKRAILEAAAAIKQDDEPN